MKVYSFLFIISLLAAGCGGSKKSEGANSSTLQPAEGPYRLDIAVNVDGSLNEWPQPLPGYSKETALHFGITNSKDYLFVAVACSDDRAQRKMLRSGMELYISENGKKETLTGIGFPLPALRMGRQTADPAGEIKTPEQTSKDFKATSNAELTQMQIFGLAKTTNGVYPITEGDCKVAYSWSDNNFFNIEYAIPLKELFTDVSAANNSNIQVGFKLNAFSYGRDNTSRGSSDGGAGSFGGGGMRGGGAGMRGGGIRGGGMRGGGMGGMRQNGDASGGTGSGSDLAKDQSFWTKYSISK